MKRIVLIVLSLGLSLQIVQAQLTPKGVSQSRVSERSETMSLGSNNALVVQLNGVSDKQVGEFWEKFMKKRFNAKAEWQRKSKEWFIDNINIPAIGGATPVDLHATAKGKENATFSLWVNMGTAFLNSYENYDQYKEAEKLMEDFVLEVEREKVAMELAEQEKQLKQFEKELERLQAANDRYHKEIEKAKAAIQEAETNIVQNEKDQEVARQKIENQKKVVETVQQKKNNIH
ncbi:MAG: hypothetical protein ACK4TA_01450 [Saprospiraceae bacterium]